MDEPLVSAIMPCRGRPAMARAAVECWRQQTWQNTELLVLDDADCSAFPEESAKASRFCPDNGWESAEMAVAGATACSSALSAGNLPDSAAPQTEGLKGQRIGYFCLPKRLTIGAKRNLACSLAHGDYIAHLDSDDRSAPDRLTDQMARP